jgi:phosphomevalonate kinase
MQVIASAPGKLVWLGEYAVLEGAPALVMAVNRRARVRLVKANDRGIRHASHGADDGGWHVEPHVLDAVARALESDPRTATAGLRAEVDSQALFARAGADRVKLGLGSSAALTVAMAGALCALAGRTLPSVDALIRAHRRGQGDRGSGVDVAAALRGGVSVYRRSQSGPRCEPVRLPTALQWCCVWSGHPASTRELLAAMSSWRGRSPARYAAAMTTLEAVAETGMEAIARDDADGLLAAMREYGRQLASLTESSGVGIASREHHQIGAVADACGVVYKSCGAGGGDVGVAMATDSLALAEFRRQVLRRGWQLLDLETDAHGVETCVSV